MVMLPFSKGDAPNLQTYIVLGIVGFYIVLRVFLPGHPQRGRGSITNYLLLGSDLVVAMGSVIASKGLDSGLLLYSFTPIISASLLFNWGLTSSIAGASALSLVLVHVGLSQLGQGFAWIMQDNYLITLLLYIITCALLAIIPYHTNLNIRRRVESEAIIKERQRVRREIHDGIAQSLGYLNLKARELQQSLSKQSSESTFRVMGEIQEVIENTYDDIRESLNSLSLEREELSLVPALKAYLQDFTAKTGIQVESSFPQGEIDLLPNEELQMLRIAQEALNNVRKHAAATKVWLSLRQTDKAVELTIRDNGQGLISSQDRKERHGLRIMRERIEDLGGTLSITGTPGEGTEVTARLPR